MVPFLLTLLALLHAAVGALVNVTVDDTDTSRIKYQGTWDPSSTHLSGLDYGGSHTFSSDSKANATFVFTGVAVYFLSPRWPYTVNIQISLDGGSSNLVSLVDPNTSPSATGGSESALSAVVWSEAGLANTSHTLFISYGNYIVVDGITYTEDDGTLPTSSSSSPSSTSSPASSSTPSPSSTLAASNGGTTTVPSKHNGLTIGLATALPLAALVAAALLAFAYCQRRRGLRRQPTRTKFILDDSPPAQPVYAAVSPMHRQMSEVSSSRVPSPYLSSRRSDPILPDAAHYQAFSASSHTHLPSSTSSIASNPRAGNLPPGAMSPVMPAPFPDLAPPPKEHDDLSSRSSAPSLPYAGQTSSGSGSDLRRGISKPPAYSAQAGA
ncbi:hypothetical protein B0H19DRAFT_1197055 [Mycena capillaripes]|nr:hypothetical protein B0H19DRAFT_1197055 [Mycena capillaripes]